MTTLRSRLIRLAHSNSELRGEILPLLKNAGCEKLPEGGMRDNCEKKKEEGKESASKKASSAVIRKTVSMRVRILKQEQTRPSNWTVSGAISIDFGGDVAPDAIRFQARIFQSEGLFFVIDMETMRTVSGGGADILRNLLEAALAEALNQRGESLLDTKEELPPAPKPKNPKRWKSPPITTEEFRNR
jgi:hypothetical protein